MPDVQEMKLNKNVAEDIDYAFDGTDMYRTTWTCSKCLEIIEIEESRCDFCHWERPKFRINLENKLGFKNNWVRRNKKR